MTHITCGLPVVDSSGSWLAQVAICSILASLLYPYQKEASNATRYCHLIQTHALTSHPHPDPCTPMLFADNLDFISSKEPKSLLIASINSPNVNNSNNIHSLIHRYIHVCTMKNHDVIALCYFRLHAYIS